MASNIQITAENALITAILKDSNAASNHLANLDFPIDAFSRPYVSAFVASFSDLCESGLVPDYNAVILNMSKNIPAGSHWLSNLSEIMNGQWGSPENIGFYISIIREEIRQQKVSDVRAKAAKEIELGGDPEKVNDRLRFDLEAVENGFGASKDPSSSFRKNVEELITRIEKREAPKDVLLTGLKNIDDISIGYAPGDYIIYAARPSVGKTAIAASVIVNLAMEGIKTCFHSLEQAGIQIASRMLANVADVSTRKALRRTNELPDWAQAKMLSKADVLRHIAEMVLVYDRPGRTVDEIAADSREAVKKGAKLIVIDYVQLIRSTKKSENRNLEVTHISMELKSLFRSLKVPGIVLCQLSRGLEKEKRSPILSDLRESGSLEQDADYVCFLHGEPKELEKSGWRKFIQAKGRDAGVGSCDLWFKKETTTFFDEEPGGY